jgi:zinc transporter ZupT
MELITTLKIIFIFVIYAIAFISGIVPAYYKRCKESQKFISLANSFAGGVFLAIALVHVLPEAVTNYRTLKGSDEIFPLPYFLVFCGYVFILVIDKVMFDSHALLGGHDHGGHGHGHGGHEEHSHGHEDHSDHHHHPSDNKINVSEFRETSELQKDGSIMTNKLTDDAREAQKRKV